MIYEFKSQAASTLATNQSLGELILTSIGHEISSTGVITVAQMPEAITAVKAMYADSKDSAAVAAHTASFIELLETSMKAGKAVTWGV